MGRKCKHNYRRLWQPNRFSKAQATGVDACWGAQGMIPYLVLCVAIG
jgi:hypothetical protein